MQRKNVSLLISISILLFVSAYLVSYASGEGSGNNNDVFINSVIIQPFSFLDGFKLVSQPQLRPETHRITFDEYYDYYFTPTANIFMIQGLFDSDRELAQILLRGRVLFDENDIKDYARKEEISLIITFKEGTNIANVKNNKLTDIVSSAGGKLKTRINVYPIAIVSVKRPNIFWFTNLIRTFNSVELIEVNSRLEYYLDESVDMIFEHGNEPGGREWLEEHLPPGIDLDGRGVTIAILDSGIQGDKPNTPPYLPIHIINKDLNDLDDKPGTIDPKITYSVDVYSLDREGRDSNNRDDILGHGTHVASIAAGTGELSKYQFVGVAPQANLFNFKVSDSYGQELWESTVIMALDLAIKGPDGIIQDYNDPQYDGADVISMSFGKQETLWNEHYYDSMVLEVEDIVNNHNVVVVIAAGNEGSDGDGGTVYETIRSPARAPSAITVGNIYKERYLNEYSSKGPAPFPSFYDPINDDVATKHIVKPEVVAPGTKICAARVVHSLIEVAICGDTLPCPALVNEYLEPCADYDGLFGGAVNSLYIALDGTSMAAPHVAGAAALVRQLHPDWTANQVKSALVQTAQPLNDETGITYDVFEQGGGLIEIGDAVRFGGEVIPSVFNVGIHELGNEKIEFFFTGANFNRNGKNFGLHIKPLISKGIYEGYQYGDWKVYFKNDLGEWEEINIFNDYNYCLLNQDTREFKIELPLGYYIRQDTYSTLFEIEYYEFCDFGLPEPTEVVQIPMGFVVR